MTTFIIPKRHLRIDLAGFKNFVYIRFPSECTIMIDFHRSFFITKSEDTLSKEIRLPEFLSQS